ncbi:MAG: type II toxin-antitoxin system RelE family toxin [Candidatus Methylomirabilales bacterium]
MPERCGRCAGPLARRRPGSGCVKRGSSAPNDPLPDPLYPHHPLAFELTGFRSLRVSRYRVIYRVQEADRTIEIHLVGARRDIYEVFRQFLERDPQP